MSGHTLIVVIAVVGFAIQLVGLAILAWRVGEVRKNLWDSQYTLDRILATLDKRLPRP